MASTKKWKSAVAPLCVILLTILGIQLLDAFKPEPEKRPELDISPLEIKAKSYWPQDYQVEIESQGRIEAKHRIELAAQVQGQIISKSQNFQRGGFFKKGELLVQIDDDDYQAALKAAIAEKHGAQHELSEAQARSEVAIADWRKLYANGEPSDFAAKRTQVAAAKARLDAAEATVFKAQLDLDRTKIIAPFDGYVISEVLDAGNYVFTGNTIGTIVAADQLKVALPISTRWREFVHSGHEEINSRKFPSDLVVTLRDLPNATWSAKLNGTVAKIDEQSRQMTLIADIDIASGSREDVRLLIGDFVKASIKGRKLNNVFVLPRNSLNEGQYVWAVKENRVYKKAVSAIWTDDHQVILDAGLEPGELIATSNLGSVISGTAVSVKEDEQHSDQQQANAEHQEVQTL